MWLSIQVWTAFSAKSQVVTEAHPAGRLWICEWLFLKKKTLSTQELSWKGTDLLQREITCKGSHNLICFLYDITIEWTTALTCVHSTCRSARLAASCRELGLLSQSSPRLLPRGIDGYSQSCFASLPQPRLAPTSQSAVISFLLSSALLSLAVLPTGCLCSSLVFLPLFLANVCERERERQTFINERNKISKVFFFTSSPRSHAKKSNQIPNITRKKTKQNKKKEYVYKNSQNIVMRRCMWGFWGNQRFWNKSLGVPVLNWWRLNFTRWRSDEMFHRTLPEDIDKFSLLTSFILKL